jgi:hypothetical protein
MVIRNLNNSNKERNLTNIKELYIKVDEFRNIQTPKYKLLLAARHIKLFQSNFKSEESCIKSINIALNFYKNSEFSIYEERYRSLNVVIVQTILRNCRDEEKIICQNMFLTKPEEDRESNLLKLFFIELLPLSCQSTAKGYFCYCYNYSKYFLIF